MEDEHRVYKEFDILLAVNFLNREEKDEIIEKVREKVFEKDYQINQNVDTRIFENDYEIVENIMLSSFEKEDFFNEKVKKRDFVDMDEQVLNTFIRQEDKVLQIKEHIITNDSVTQSQDSNGFRKADLSVENVDLNSRAPPIKSFKMPKGLEIIPFAKVPLDMVNKYSMEIAEVSTAVDISNISVDIGIQKISSILWKCPKCGQKFPNNRYSRQKYEGMKKLCWTTCKKCWMQFEIPGELRKHIKLSKKCRKQNKTKMLKCGECDRIFFWKNTF